MLAARAAAWLQHDADGDGDVSVTDSSGAVGVLENRWTETLGSDASMGYWGKKNDSLRYYCERGAQSGGKEVAEEVGYSHDGLMDDQDQHLCWDSGHKRYWEYSQMGAYLTARH